MPLRPLLLPRSLISLGAMALAALLLSSCSDFGLWGEREATNEPPKANAEAASGWEMTLMAGRYSVMLDQARGILNLPEPEDSDAHFPSGSGEGSAEREALAAQQVRVAREAAQDGVCASGRRAGGVAPTGTPRDRSALGAQRGAR
jgi:hypothetical protein